MSTVAPLNTNASDVLPKSTITPAIYGANAPRNDAPYIRDTTVD